MPSPNDERYVAEPADDEGTCSYCGAKLSQFFYFCLACGTPYRAVDSVLSPLRPRILTGEELVEIKAPHVAGVFWTYFATMIGTAVLAHLAFNEDRPDLQLFVAELITAVVTLVLGIRHRRALGAQLRMFGFNCRTAYGGLVLLAPLLLLNLGYHSLFRTLGAEYADSMQELRSAGASTAALVVVFCVFPAIVEELAFRGLVQHWLHAALRPLYAITVASALFAAMHLTILSWPYLFLVGVLLGWTRYRTGSLYPSMLIHFLHNLCVIELFPYFGLE